MLLLPALAAAQDQPGQPTDGPQAVLRGVVLGESDEPLAGARVIAAGDAARRDEQTRTNRNGEFDLAVPQAGPVTLGVLKAGYAYARLTHGRAGAGDALEVRLKRGAVLAGHVFDERGEPLADVRVSVRPVAGRLAAPTVPAARLEAITDDLGEYRIGSLPAGTYEVEYAATQWNTGRSIVRVFRSANAAAGGADAAREKPQPTIVELESGVEAIRALVLEGADARRRRSVAAYVSGYRSGAETARRQMGASEKKGTSTIAGRILGPDGRPLAAAMVRVTSGIGGGALVVPSGDDGRYTIPEVPAGAYRVTASSSGTMEAAFGAAPGNPGGAWLTVGDDGRLEDIDLVLPRAGVISGRLVDEFGEPVEGISVHVWRSRWLVDREVLEPVTDIRPHSTDDRGRYRLHGLQPGTYYVVATDARESALRVAGPPTFSIPRPGASTWVIDSSDASRSLTIRVESASMPDGPRSYYPGRASVQEALPVQIDAGLDAFGIDFEFAPSPTARVSGVVLNAAGEPSAGDVRLAVSRRSGALVLPPQNTRATEAGRFEFSGVAPGEYAVVARTAPKFSPGSGAMYEIGAAVVTVGTSDTGPVAIRTVSGSTVEGRIRLEGPDVFGRRASDFSLRAVTADPDLGFGSPATFGVAEDGTFRAPRLVGPLRFVAGAVPAGWWLKSVRIGGVNAADEPVTFGTADQSRQNVEVVFSSEVTEISGRVLDSRNESVLGAAVLVFPVDWTRRENGARYLRRAVTRVGQFSVPALPPGDYYVRAIDSASLTDNEWQRPDVLNSLASSAHMVTIREGQPVSVDLELVRVP